MGMYKVPRNYLTPDSHRSDCGEWWFSLPFLGLSLIFHQKPATKGWMVRALFCFATLPALACLSLFLWGTRLHRGPSFIRSKLRHSN